MGYLKFKRYCIINMLNPIHNWNRNFHLFFMFSFEFQYFWTFFYESKRHFSPRNIVHAPLLEITILGRSQMKPALKQTSLAPGIAAGIPHWHEVWPIGEFQAYRSRCINSKKNPNKFTVSNSSRLCCCIYLYTTLQQISYWQPRLAPRNLLIKDFKFYGDCMYTHNPRKNYKDIWKKKK